MESEKPLLIFEFPWNKTVHLGSAERIKPKGALGCMVSKMVSDWSLNSPLFEIYLALVSQLKRVFVFPESFWRPLQPLHFLALYKRLLYCRHTWHTHVPCGAVKLSPREKFDKQKAPLIIQTALHMNGLRYSKGRSHQERYSATTPQTVTKTTCAIILLGSF